MAYTPRLYGIDISEWQDWNWNFNNWNGNKFVILRAGYGYRNSGGFGQATDAYFNHFYTNATNARCRIGVYWYAMAKTMAEARQEADYCWNLVKDLNIPWGIWYDIEDSSIPSSQYVGVSRAFCTRIQSKGYSGIIGIYANASSWSNYLLQSQYANYINPWYRWVADWGADDGTLNHITTIPNCFIQQYGKKPYFNTETQQDSRYDVDVFYGAKPPGQGGGYVDPDDPIFGSKKKYGSGNAEKKKVDDIVLEIYQGKWGNGKERKQKLTKAGYNYDVVQNRVNALTIIAKDVIKGKYGNGAYRKQALGSIYDVVQNIVDILLKG